MSIPIGDPGEIVIQDLREIDPSDQVWRFRVRGDVIDNQSLAIFQRKTVIGDYSRDSNPLLSTWVGTDMSGGHGVQILEEGTDVARYRFGVVDARKPRQITCPPLTRSMESPNGDTCYPLGQIKRSADFILAFGVAVYVWDEITDTLTDSGQVLAAAPVNKAVSYKGKLYIPNGSSFDTWNGAAIVNETDFAASAFCKWDRRLFGIAQNGQIWETYDGVAWTSLGDDGKIDDEYVVRDMVSFFDRSDFPQPIIITDQGLWAFDPAGPTLYQTQVQYPPHRDQGLGSDVWRGELYTSVAMGTFRFNGSTVSPMGLDRDQGLPPAIRGRIVDLLNEYNGMYALVSGAEYLEASDEPLIYDATDDEWYVSASSAVSSLHIWTGYGWHCYWTSGDATGLPTWSKVCAVGDTYRLWWGAGATAQTMILPIDFASARALIESGTGEFSASAYFDTGMFDAGLTSYTKIANSMLLRTLGTSTTSTISVFYRIADTDGFTLLGTATEPGELLLSIGGYEGLANKEIEFRFVLTRDPDDVSAAPILTSWVFSYLKVLPAYHSLQAKIDLTAPYSGRSTQEMRNKIEQLLASTYFYTLINGETAYRGRFAQGGGQEYTGRGDDRADYPISFIEIPADL